MEEKFDEIEAKVKNVIMRVLQVDDAAVKRTSTIADLGGDSLAALGILAALEQEFEIDIPDEEALKITSFVTAVEVVRKHTK
ncbi:MAG: phosphopantetheine-binding protein [Candidatus Eisenbacteria bacterium]